MKGSGPLEVIPTLTGRCVEKPGRLVQASCVAAATLLFYFCTREKEMSSVTHPRKLRHAGKSIRFCRLAGPPPLTRLFERLAWERCGQSSPVALFRPALQRT